MEVKMARIRRKHSPEFKLKAVIELLIGQKLASSTESEAISKWE